MNMQSKDLRGTMTDKRGKARKQTSGPARVSSARSAKNHPGKQHVVAGPNKSRLGGLTSM